ncbi:DEKNAAC102231 [Brettanomyces naardenensis]|uniref:DEKNAAC102231 n=1 Tax=Brettanomyces naardenensis TaxID=13370 RepID=A0A448YLQ6_BRENA|nr:DEKNAAC102231 [Brettanomyces naardenensis]
MGILDTHAHTAVSSTINKLIEQTSPSDGIMEAELPNLIDMIKLQTDFAEPGPTEAARAIRKKLKYGVTKAQYNALNLLDLLVANGGNGKMVLFYNDRKLLDRIVALAAPYPEGSVDAKVSKKARSLVTIWRNEYVGDQSRESLVGLFSRCGFGKGKIRRAVPDFMNDEADQETPFEEYGSSSAGGSASSTMASGYGHDNSFSSRPKTNSELDKQYRIPKINYEKETPRIYQTIAEADVLATNLQNSLRSLQPGELSIHSAKANDSFDSCRIIRRKILRYLQLVDKEELLGALLKCNDELVKGLQRYEELGQPRDDSDDEDSLAGYETDELLDDGLGREEAEKEVGQEVKRVEEVKMPEKVVKKSRKVTPARIPPPIPPKSPSLRVKEDDDDPFSDVNKVERAAVWR